VALCRRLLWARRREEVVHRIVQAAVLPFERRLEADLYRRVGIVIPTRTVEQIDQRIGSFMKLLVESLSKAFEDFDRFDIV